MLVCIAALARFSYDDPVHQVLVGGESLGASKEELLARWAPFGNVEQTEMGLYLEKDGNYLEVLYVSSGPFQFTGESLTLPEGLFVRGDSKSSIRAVLGAPLHVSGVPHLGSEFSADRYTRRNSFGWPVASIVLTYQGERLFSCTAWREDRRDEFKDVHGHMFGELPDSYYDTEASSRLPTQRD